MKPQPPRSTPTDTLFPSTTVFRSVVVAGILYPGNAPCPQSRHVTRLRAAEQRTQQAQGAGLADRRHRGQAVEPAAAAEPQQEGLRLVLQVVRQRQVEDALGLAEIGRAHV